MRLKATLTHKTAKAPEPINDWEWVFFAAEKTYFDDRVIYKTGVHIDPPTGFRLTIRPHPDLLLLDVIHMERVRNITPGNKDELTLMVALFSTNNSPEDFPGVGKPIAIVSLERCSEAFKIEISGKDPDADLMKINNFN